MKTIINKLVSHALIQKYVSLKSTKKQPTVKYHSNVSTLCLLQEQYQFLYDALEGMFPVQNGEVKAAQATAVDAVQIVNETKAAEQKAEEKAEQPPSTTSDDQQGVAENTPLVPDAGKEDKKEESEKDAPTETTPLEDTSNGPTVTVEV